MSGQLKKHFVSSASQRASDRTHLARTVGSHFFSIEATNGLAGREPRLRRSVALGGVIRVGLQADAPGQARPQLNRVLPCLPQEGSRLNKPVKQLAQIQYEEFGSNLGP